MITEISIPLLVLIGIIVTLGTATTIYLEISSRKYKVGAYLLWTATLVLALLTFVQEVAMAGVAMFFIAFMFIIVSTQCKLSQKESKQ